MTLRDTLRSDSGPDLQFSGSLVAQVSNHAMTGAQSERWTELAIYETEDKKYVVFEINRSRVAGEHNKYHAEGPLRRNEIAGSLGYGPLAKLLYEKAGIAAPLSLSETQSKALVEIARLAYEQGRSSKGGEDLSESIGWDHYLEVFYTLCHQMQNTEQL